MPRAGSGDVAQHATRRLAVGDHVSSRVGAGVSVPVAWRAAPKFVSALSLAAGLCHYDGGAVFRQWRGPAMWLQLQAGTHCTIDRSTR